MRYAKRFLTMFCTAGTLLFLGFHRLPLEPNTMIGITGIACGLVNVLCALWRDSDETG